MRRDHAILDRKFSAKRGEPVYRFAQSSDNKHEREYLIGKKKRWESGLWKVRA